MKWLACSLAAWTALTTAGAAQQPMPPAFVYLREVDASIAQDMRYAGEDNFIGRRLPGYEAAECVLRSDAANALRRVQTDLATHGLGLKVYDCYRPARASRAMLAWANDGRPDALNKRFYPGLDKRGLFSLGYIATRSQHQTGTAVDLTLIQKSSPPSAPFDPRAVYDSCIAPAPQRAPDNSLDMGTGYDCFDARSHTRSTMIGAEAQRLRKLLVDAMAQHGFRNYHREWWHFEFQSTAPVYHYDVPISMR
jgi:D-alanyl-D-alanine dipeptidase